MDQVALLALLALPWWFHSFRRIKADMSKVRSSVLANTRIMPVSNFRMCEALPKVYSVAFLGRAAMQAQ